MNTFNFVTNKRNPEWELQKEARRLYQDSGVGVKVCWRRSVCSDLQACLAPSSIVLTASHGDWRFFKLFTGPSSSLYELLYNPDCTELGVWVLLCRGSDDEQAFGSLRGFDIGVCQTRLCWVCFYFLALRRPPASLLLSIMCLTFSSLLLLANLKEEVGETTSCFLRVLAFVLIHCCTPERRTPQFPTQNSHNPKITGMLLSSL